MAWANFAAGLGRFANAVPQLLFPGLGTGGIDPAIAQQLRSQALMQMGAGLASGQDIAKSYGLGQAAGNEAFQNYARQQALQMAQEDRASDQEYRGLLMKDREQKLKDDADERERRAKGDAILTAPLPEEPKQRSAELKRRADALRTIGDQRGASLISEAYAIDSDLMQRENAARAAGNMAVDNARAQRSEQRAIEAQGLGRLTANYEVSKQIAAQRADEAVRVAIKQMSENEPGTPLWNSAASVYRQYSGKDIPRNEFGEPMIHKGAPTEAGRVGSAPPAAIEALKRNPDKAQEFLAKYGYLPPGF